MFVVASFFKCSSLTSFLSWSEITTRIALNTSLNKYFIVITSTVQIFQNAFLWTINIFQLPEAWTVIESYTKWEAYIYLFVFWGSENKRIFSLAREIDFEIYQYKVSKLNSGELFPRFKSYHQSYYSNQMTCHA